MSKSFILKLIICISILDTSRKQFSLASSINKDYLTKLEYTNNNDNNNENNNKPINLNTLSSSSSSSSSSSLKTKETTSFFIVSTGNQLKLYPSSGKHFENSIHEYNFYLLIPTNESLRADNAIKCSSSSSSSASSTYSNSPEPSSKTQILQQNNASSSSLYHLTEKSLQVNNSAFVTQNSYLIGYFNTCISNHHDQLITKVDYFLDSTGNHCSTNNNQSQSSNTSASSEIYKKCLIVTWLDTRNDEIHFASVNLDRQKINLLINSKQKENFIYYNEFSTFKAPNLDNLTRENDTARVNLNGNCTSNLSKIINFSVINYNSKQYLFTLHASCKDNFFVSSYQLLSGNSTLGVKYNFEHRVNDYDSQCNSLNNDTDEGLKKKLSIRGKSMDIDKKRKSLFYLDENGKILKVNIAFGLPANQSIRPNLVIDTQASDGLEALAFALDTKSARVVWLDSNHQFKSCNYNGNNIEYLGKMNKKPILANPFELLIHEKQVLISDSDKKALIIYELPIIGTSANALNVKDSIANLSSHKSVIVEMNGLYGFKFVYNINKTNNDLNGHYDDDYDDEDEGSYDEVVNDFSKFSKCSSLSNKSHKTESLETSDGTIDIKSTANFENFEEAAGCLILYILSFIIFIITLLFFIYMFAIAIRLLRYTRNGLQNSQLSYAVCRQRGDIDPIAFKTGKTNTAIPGDKICYVNPTYMVDECHQQNS